MRQTASTAGNGNFIVQIQGDGNSIVTGLPHLELTRRHGIARRIEVDPSTGKSRESDVIRPFTHSIELVGRETELDDLRGWLRKESAISVRVLTGSAGYGKTRLALELIEEMAPQGWCAGFLTRAELKRFRVQHDLAGWGWNAPILAVVDYASASARDLHAWLKELEDHAVWEDADSRNRYPLRLLLLERQAERGNAPRLRSNGIQCADRFRCGEQPPVTTDQTPLGTASAAPRSRRCFFCKGCAVSASSRPSERATGYSLHQAVVRKRSGRRRPQARSLRAGAAGRFSRDHPGRRVHPVHLCVGDDLYRIFAI